MSREATVLRHQAECQVQETGPDLSLALGSQWTTIRGSTAKRIVKSMVAHCCDASMNLKFAKRRLQAFAPFPSEFDLYQDSFVKGHKLQELRQGLQSTVGI